MCTSPVALRMEDHPTEAAHLTGPTNSPISNRGYSPTLAPPTSPAGDPTPPTSRQAEVEATMAVNLLHPLTTVAMGIPLKATPTVAGSRSPPGSRSAPENSHRHTGSLAAILTEVALPPAALTVSNHPRTTAVVEAPTGDRSR